MTIDHSKRSEMFKGLEEINPTITMWFIVLSLGLYIIYWIYMQNKEFEKIDEYAPEHRRGAVVMIFLPFGWGLIMYVLSSLIFLDPPLLVEVMEIVIWGLIIFLTLNYLLDFSLSFGKVTHTKGIFWFLMFLVGIIGVISTIFSFYYLTPMIFFIVIAIPVMQAELNTHTKKKNVKSSSSILSMH